MTAADDEQPVVERTADGAVVKVGDEVRARFVGDLDDPAEQAALDELVNELFGRPRPPPGK